MSFNEKLQYLRKEKKLSQEQLADMLDVTRQSVSKWESGTTYPEMDKLIMLCKIFKCSLDDLTNDEITEINVDKKETSNNIVYSFLSFIDKTVKMFQYMSTKEIIKCLFSMFVIGILLLVFEIPFEIIKSGFSDLVFNYGTNRVTFFITSLFDLVLIIIFVVLYIIAILYIFKAAYLDKYSFVAKEKIEEVVTTKEPIREVKIVTNPTPREDNAIFRALGNVMIGFVKFLVACFCFPVVGVLLAVCFCLAIDIYLICNGIVFIGTVFLLVFLLIGCAWLLECASVFLFNRKVSFYRLLWTFIISIVGAGISAGVCFLEMYDIEYVNHLPESFIADKRTQEKEYQMNEGLSISDYPHMIDIQYVEDESMVDTVKVTLEYYDDGMEARFIDYSDKIDVDMNYVDGSKVFHTVVENLKNTLKDKVIYNYEDLSSLRMTVTSSSGNINKIIENSEKVWEENYHNSCQYEIDSYESQINDYENRIDEYESDIEDLQAQNEQLEEKVQELEEYKLRVQDILNE